MAINSAERRRSAVGVSFHYYSPGVSPTSGKDVSWRQQAGHSYSGIDPSALTPVGRSIAMVGYYAGDRPAPQSFVISSGEDVTFQVTVKDIDGVAVDITGGSGRFAMARNTGATAAVDSDAGSSTITVQDAGAGRVDISIADTMTDNLLGDYYYEFKWTDDIANELVVAFGWITVAPSLI